MGHRAQVQSACNPGIEKFLIGTFLSHCLGLPGHWWTRLLYQLVVWAYRDRRVERQRRWPEALFRRLATLSTSDSVPL